MVARHQMDPVGGKIEVARRVRQFELVEFFLFVGLPEQQKSSSTSPRNADGERLGVKHDSPTDSFEFAFGFVLNFEFAILPVENDNGWVSYSREGIGDVGDSTARQFTPFLIEAKSPIQAIIP